MYMPDLDGLPHKYYTMNLVKQ